MKKADLLRRVFFLWVFGALFTIKGYGYIDPGTGSYLIQVLVAAVVAIPFAIKIFWKKIKGLFSKSKKAE